MRCNFVKRRNFDGTLFHYFAKSFANMSVFRFGNHNGMYSLFEPVLRKLSDCTIIFKHVFFILLRQYKLLL